LTTLKSGQFEISKPECEPGLSVVLNYPTDMDLFVSLDRGTLTVKEAREIVAERRQMEKQQNDEDAIDALRRVDD
jgi:hypothetical protein